MIKKLWTLLTFILLATMALAACSPATPTEPAATEPPVVTEEIAPTEVPTEAPAGPVTISFWEQDSDADALFQALIDEFMIANPDIIVERTHYENEPMRQLFQEAALNGTAPDVVRGPNDNAGPFSTLQIVAPMDQLFDQAFLDQFFPGALVPAVTAGTLWGIPDTYGNHLMLIYNKSLIAEAPATFEDLIVQAKALTAGDIQGFAYPLDVAFWGAGFYGAFGGWPLDENDVPQFNNQAFIDYLTFVYNLKTEGVIPLTCDSVCVDTLFTEGKAAMIINGDWSLGGYAEAIGEENLGVAPVPPVNGNPYTEMTSGKYYMVSSAVLDDPAKKAAVIRFITFMTSAEAQTRWLEEFKALPSNIEVAANPLIASDPILAGSMAALANGRGMSSAASMRCAWDSWGPALTGVMAGTLTPEAAAVAAQAAADKCMTSLAP